MIAILLCIYGTLQAIRWDMEVCLAYGHALLCWALHRPHTGLPPLPTKEIWWSLCKFKVTLTTFFFISRRREWKKEGWRHRERKDEMSGRASSQMEEGCWGEKGGARGRKKEEASRFLLSQNCRTGSAKTLSISLKGRDCIVSQGGRRWLNYRGEMAGFPVAEKARRRQVPLKVRSPEEMFWWSDPYGGSGASVRQWNSESWDKAPRVRKWNLS